MLKVKNLTKYFAENKVLDNLNFEINENEIVGLLGPNGAGKTTTMRILTGFLPYESGEVEILDKKDIGYLPEDNPLYTDMLVFEYLNFIAELKKINKKNKYNIINNIIQQTGISSVYYRPISELSKGFKQRVGLATAIIGDPKILILDEPTEGLDPNQRIDIRNLIKELGKNKTVIISSHVLSEVESTCNRIIIINKGRIVKDDKTENILNINKNKLIIKLQGENILEKINLIANSVNLVNQVNSIVELEIKADNLNNIIPQISKLIVENNWIVWELKIQENKLEDVFRELTK